MDKTSFLMDEITHECWKCTHLIHVGQACKCLNPDPEMTGAKFGIDFGFFDYPENFRPIWKTKKCSNFTKKDSE